jgi:hypothetical protein
LFKHRNNPLRHKTFELGGVEHPYLVHPYNHTWANERAVEIPVIRSYMQDSEPSSTLEVGNVSSHYFPFAHTVVDKHERCLYRPIIHQDIVDYSPGRRYDTIVSVSTIEHVGWDEKPRDETKVMDAFKKLRSLLAPGGKAIVTFPVGHNQALDRRVREATEGSTIRCLKRISADNQWAETDLEAALLCKYGTPYPNANAVVFVHLSGDTPPGRP